AERLAAGQLARAVADVGSLLVVGRVDVQELRRRARRADVRRDRLGQRQGDLAVEVHADDAHAAAAEPASPGGAEAARGAQDEPPFAREWSPVRVVGHVPRTITKARRQRYPLADARSHPTWQGAGRSVVGAAALRYLRIRGRQGRSSVG